MASSNERTRRSLNVRMVQNFHLVWLDGSIDEENDEDCRSSIKKLRQIINTVNTFTNVDECIDFITDTNEEMTSIIVSREIIEIIAPIVQEISQVNSIYILCENEAQSATWTKECFKVKGMFTNITTICEALEKATQDFDHNSISLSFVQKTHTFSNQNLDTLDQSFMYTQILKEILITIDFQQSHIHEFLAYCREQLAGNTTQLANVDKIEKEYPAHQPIWWYTYESFLYSMLNRALRLMEIDQIIKMGFFVRDLHRHIAKLHSEQFDGQNHSDSFTVYRGQGLSQKDFDQLKKTQDGLLAFNNFLSTSIDHNISLRFVRRTVATSDLMGVLFVIKIDPSVSTTPFANVKTVSYYKKEEEILFSMHSIFRIGQAQQIEGNNRLYQVNLTLTSDNDPQLHALTESIQEETSGSIGWYRLAKLLITLGQFNKAEELHTILLERAHNQTEKASVYHHLGLIKYNQGNYAEAAQFYEKALEIWQKTLPANHPDLTASYNNIGLVYKTIGEWSKALSYYGKVLEIQQKTLPANHPNLATSYSNIGGVYDSLRDYSKALSYYEKVFEIRQKTLPANHPSLAASCNLIGGIYHNIGEYSKALSHCEKALEIFEKTLPENHPVFGNSYNNIGKVYDNVGECSKALSYHEKALEIWQRTLPANHPNLAISYNNIGAVYNKMGDYSKALSYREKAHEIFKKTLPANHSDLATSYNSISLVYYNMREWSKALSHCEKALEIFEKTLPASHPDWATSYNNIGRVYCSMGEYSKAFSYHEKAHEIFKNTLPVNHPDLATSYNNIGLVCCSMGKYSKALSYHEKAHEIFEKSLSANHSDLAMSYNNIGGVYNNMGEYSKSLSYYEKSLEISQKTLPANYPLLATSYSNIGVVYYSIGECSKAFSYLERALDIQQRLLPPNHPDIRNVKQSIEIVKKKL